MPMFAPVALDASQIHSLFGSLLSSLRLPQINNNSIMHRAAISCFAFTRIGIDLLAEIRLNFRLASVNHIRFTID